MHSADVDTPALHLTGPILLGPEQELPEAWVHQGRIHHERPELPTHWLASFRSLHASCAASSSAAGASSGDASHGAMATPGTANPVRSSSMRQLRRIA